MLLQHGTTKKWAEEIKENGPNPYFKLPDDVSEDPEGFFTIQANESFVPASQGNLESGSAEDYARRKATLFPDHGGPAILEIEIPDHLANELISEIDNDTEGKANNRGTEIWFGFDFATGEDFGITKLRATWEQLSIRVIILKEQ